MFGLFKGKSVKKLQDQYTRKLEEARDLQRFGDIVGFAKKTAEAEAVLTEIEELEAKLADKS